MKTLTTEARNTLIEEIKRTESNRKALVTLLDNQARTIEEQRGKVPAEKTQRWSVMFNTTMRRYEATCDKLRELQSQL